MLISKGIIIIICYFLLLVDVVYLTLNLLFLFFSRLTHIKYVFLYTGHSLEKPNLDFFSFKVF
jgi:ascorbate-specific PTS system EIIC-type component UlaA